MNLKRIAMMATMICTCTAAGRVEAQSFLQRLGEQINKQISPPSPNPAAHSSTAHSSSAR